jgi:pimeloyl-ACP methyl ester carboxylesterase
LASAFCASAILARKECEDVLALQAATGASFLVGHSYGGLVALEVARNNKAFNKIAVYEPGVSIDGSMPTGWMPGYEKKLAEKRNVDALSSSRWPTRRHVSRECLHG